MAAEPEPGSLTCILVSLAEWQALRTLAAAARLLTNEALWKHVEEGNPASYLPVATAWESLVAALENLGE